MANALKKLFKKIENNKIYNHTKIMLKLFKYFILFSFSFLLSYFIIEIFLRFVYSPDSLKSKIYNTNMNNICKDATVPHPLRKYLFKSNFEGKFNNIEYKTFVKINSKGLRNRETQYEHNKKRILFVGDSFTFGWGVEQNEAFPYICENLFNKKIEVINAGVPGYSILEYYLYLKEELFKYKPNIIILVFYGENDMIYVDLNSQNPTIIKNSDNRFEISEKNISRNLYNRTKPVKINFLKLTYSNIKNYFRHNSYFYNLLSIYVIRKIKINLEMENYYSFESQRIYLEFLIDEFIKLSKENNSDFVIFYAPSYILLDAIQTNNFSVYALREKKILDGLIQLSKNKNILFINQPEEFIKNNIKKLYFPMDRHWTKEGHKVASQIIFNAIKNNFIRRF